MTLLIASSNVIKDGSFFLNKVSLIVLEWVMMLLSQGSSLFIYLNGIIIHAFLVFKLSSLFNSIKFVQNTIKSYFIISFLLNQCLFLFIIVLRYWSWFDLCLFCVFLIFLDSNTLEFSLRLYFQVIYFAVLDSPPTTLIFLTNYLNFLGINLLILFVRICILDCLMFNFLFLFIAFLLDSYSHEFLFFWLGFFNFRCCFFRLYIFFCYWFTFVF